MIASLLLVSWYTYFSGKNSHLVSYIYIFQQVVKEPFVCVIFFKKLSLKIHCFPPALISSIKHFILSSLIFSVVFLNHFLSPPLYFQFTLPFLYSATSSLHQRIFTVPLNHNSQEQMDRDIPLNNETRLVQADYCVLSMTLVS